LKTRKQDIIFSIGVILLFLPFILSNDVFDFYFQFNHDHILITSFIKFAILATMGELIGLRIRTGSYYVDGFGVLPRMLVWGFLGITIYMAMVISASGTPKLLENLGVSNAQHAILQSFTLKKLFVAFCISLALNVVYAPVMMTLHKITDMHILATGGTLKGFFTSINFGKLFVDLDWNIQWNFVFKKTIPFFWIPAHTITFLLPADFRILFAAILGVALGIILAIADLMGSDEKINRKKNKIELINK
jgi:hypothetical protein